MLERPRARSLRPAWAEPERIGEGRLSSPADRSSFGRTSAPPRGRHHRPAPPYPRDRLSARGTTWIGSRDAAPSRSGRVQRLHHDLTVEYFVFRSSRASPCLGELERQQLRSNGVYLRGSRSLAR